MNAAGFRIWALALGLAAGAFLASTGRAQALVEFCPAEVWDYTSSSPSQDVDYQVGALGTRTVEGTLAVQTDKGWFTVAFPKVALTPHQRTYASPHQRFTRTDIYSDVLVAHFPQPVVVRRMWVVDAAATATGPFAWDDRGKVPCEPTNGATLKFEQPLPSHGQFTREAQPQDTPAPSPAAAKSQPVVTNAVAVDPPAGLDCAHPFSGAHVKFISHPDASDASETYDSNALAIVALDARGNMVDAWLWEPAPTKAINDALLTAVRLSRYAPATALCHPVPTITYFEYTIFTQPEAPPAPGH